MLVLDLNWLLQLLGLVEKRAPISDHSNTLAWIVLFTLLAIVIGLGLHLHHLVENREPNHNANDVDQEVEEHPSGELDHYFDGSHQLPHRTATCGSAASGRVACAFCGNPSSTRCSRCKVARYCSMECQIRHWRSGHKYECFETETAADEARPIHDHGTYRLVMKSEKESTSKGSHGEVKWSSEAGVEVPSGSDVNNFNGCEVCGNPSTTRCSRCKTVRYCSPKCLIVNWRWHKVHCIAREVNSAPTERPDGDVEVLDNSYEDEDNVHPSGPLSLEYHPEGTTNFKSPTKVSQDPPTKEAQVHTTELVRYQEDEVGKSRNEILLLQSERDEWKKRANFARERFRSLKKEYEYRLFMLKNEKESISNAEKKACNVIHSLYERLNHLQIAVQENIAEKRKLEEYVQMIESESAELKKELQDEHKRVQFLSVESAKSHETAQIAIREIEALRQELQEKREHVQRLTEDFRRDVSFAESRAAFAEAKLRDLHRKIRLKDHKAAVVTSSLGRPAMACAICLTNEKDLAFGCGHMTCRDCGTKLSTCPICREQITSHIRLFPG